MTPPERVSITVERVDDYADRRYLVTVTLTIPANSAGEAIEAVSHAISSLGAFG